MQTFTESGIIFNFPKKWAVKKYDDHRFYQYLSGLGLKGLDFIAITNDRKLLLLEVKNFRDRFLQDGIDPTEKLLQEQNDFSNQIIKKFKDTFRLIKIIQQYQERKWWFRWIGKPLLHSFFGKKLLGLDWVFWHFANELLLEKRIKLVLWLEVNAKLEEKEFQNLNQKIQSKLQKEFKYAHFEILNIGSNDKEIFAGFSK